MSTRISAFTSADSVAHTAKVFTAQGAQEGSDIAATHSGAGTYLYYFDAPGTLAVGRYTFGLYRDDTDALSSAGEFWFDGTDVQSQAPSSAGISAAEVRSEADAALAAYDGPTKAELDVATAGVSTLSAAEVRSEAAAALAAYDGPTKVELDSAIAGIDTLTAAEVRSEADAALADYDPPTKAELDAATAGGGLSAAEVRSEADAALADYDPPTKDELDAAIAGVSTLTSVEIRSEVDDALIDFDPATSDELAQAVLDILAEAGLTPAQGDILTFIRDVVEADEVYSSLNNTAQKLHKDTKAILVKKDLATNSGADVETTLSEVTP